MLIMIKRTMVIGICLSPLVVFAQPTTQRGKGPRPGPPMVRKPTSRPADDPQEFNTALAFLEKVSPNRFKAYQSLDEDRRGIFRERILAFYRNNQWINRDDELWKLREQVIKAEDDVFSIRWDILAGGGVRRASDEDKSRLRYAVAQMVKSQLQERALRLERLKDHVKQEEDQLAGIKTNMDDYIDHRYRDELEGRGLGLFDHPKRPGAGGPGGPASQGSSGSGPNDKARSK
jgi:hypothetical protein